MSGSMAPINKKQKFSVTQNFQQKKKKTPDSLQNTNFNTFMNKDFSFENSTSNFHQSNKKNRSFNERPYMVNNSNRVNNSITSVINEKPYEKKFTNNPNNVNPYFTMQQSSQIIQPTHYVPAPLNDIFMTDMAKKMFENAYSQFQQQQPFGNPLINSYSDNLNARFTNR
jgi:hypothetical protein